MVPSTEELTRRRRDWYTDRKTTELIWRWPEVNRKLLNSFEYTSNSLELSWIHFESFGLTWNYWKFLELDKNYLEFGSNHLEFSYFEETLSNGWEFLWIWKTSFWTISNFVMLEENHWIIYGNHWNILESIRKFWNHLRIFQFGQNWNGIKLYNCKFLESWSNSMEKCPRRQMICKLRLWNDVHPGSY